MKELFKLRKVVGWTVAIREYSKWIRQTNYGTIKFACDNLNKLGIDGTFFDSQIIELNKYISIIVVRSGGRYGYIRNIYSLNPTQKTVNVYKTYNPLEEN